MKLAEGKADLNAIPKSAQLMSERPRARSKKKAAEPAHAAD
jgi:hypothetical protein